MVECSNCCKEIEKCEWCELDIIKEADETDIWCSSGLHFCSLECALDDHEIVKIRLKKEN